MRLIRSVSVLVLAVAFSGCYHATIDTGLTPNNVTVKKEWAHGFIYGLVPPSVVETVSKCPNGAAKVETQLSFLNEVASILTWGIYTPMTIEVQCAGARSASAESATVTVPKEASRADLTRAVQKAVDTAASTGQPATIRVQ